MEQSKLDYFFKKIFNEMRLTDCVTVIDRLTAPWRKPA